MMNHLRRLLTPILLTLALACPLVHAKANADERAIRQTLALYESALNAADAKTVAHIYTQDGVQMAPDTPAVVGRAAVAAAYDALFHAISLKLSFTVDEVKVLSKTSAYLRSHSKGTLKVNGTDQPAGPAAFKELFILKKQADGEWKFSHYSFSSVPTAPQ
jgi:uncharacterized protein (TIGR02246 family)